MATVYTCQGCSHWGVFKSPKEDAKWKLCDVVMLDGELPVRGMDREVIGHVFSPGGMLFSHINYTCEHFNPRPKTKDLPWDDEVRLPLTRE